MGLYKNVFAVLGLAMFSNVNAASIIQDQTSGLTRQIYSFSPLGQSFTAEDESILSIGFFVTDINPNFAPSFELSVELFEGEGFAGQSLGIATLSLSDGFAGYADFDFSFVDLVIGNMYSAQIISSTSRGGIQINQHSYPNGTQLGGGIDYTGGDHIINGAIDSISDTRFRVIAASPVPVPAAVWLFGSGLIGLAGFMKNSTTKRRA